MASWEDNVRKVVPYTPGEQPKIANIIKLNTNENPYPPSPAVLKALRETDGDYLRRYPDPKSQDLTDAFARLHGIDSSRVFAGVGSDDVLAMCFLTFFNSEKPVLFPDITYSFYDVWADLFRIPYRTVPLDENFGIVKEDYYGENGGVIFPNPNAPTGIPMKQSDVTDILDRNKDVVVIVDEAYVDFCGESMLGLTGEYENLLVVQTLSKSRALAGMRIGFAVGSEKLIRYLNDVKYSFNSYTMNMPSLELGVEADFQEAPWDSLLAGVDAGRFDIICNGVGYTVERAKSYSFTDPYCYSNKVLVVAETNEEIKSVDDLKGKKTANSASSTYAALAEEYGATLVPVDTLGETMDMLVQGRVDATINAQVSIADYLREHPEAKIKVVQVLAGDPVAYPLHIGEEYQSLVDAINDVLEAARQDGRLAEISMKYFGVDMTKAE